MAKRNIQANRSFLTRDAFITKASSLKREALEIEDVGVVMVSELSGKQLLTYNERVNQMKAVNPVLDTATSMELMTMLVIMALCDEEGKPLLTEADSEAVQNTSFDVQIAIATKALELSGLAKEAVEEAKQTLKKATSESSSSS